MLESGDFRSVGDAAGVSSNEHQACVEVKSMEDKFFMYNTKSKKVEKFVPFEDGKVKIYTCGPTVYHYAHIGNLRSYIEEDVLVKTLKYIGYKVNRVMNITDVGHLSSDADTGEDKMLKGAEREHKSVMEIAKFYTDAFFSDCSKLNIAMPDAVVPATSMIPDFINVIKALMEKGYAYKAGDNVYFDTSKLSDYYSLTGHNEDDLLVGVRDDVDEDTNKKNKNDFVLWFTKSKFANQALKWNSPWGVGYPGWHIECSCIAMKNLGEHLDIHCGGVDNIFPHHTNEIAQSEAFLGHEWCKYWFHIQHLNDKSGKMSKSEGNFLTVSVLEDKKFNPLVYRMFCLQSHYRKPLEFSWEVLEQVASAYDKLKKKVLSLNEEGETDKEGFDGFRDKFEAALCNDLNTSSALTVVYDVLKSDLNDATKLALVSSFDEVLGLELSKAEASGSSDDPELAAYVEEMIARRKEAKKAKDFGTADAIRDELAGKGIIIKDTREGTVWERA